MENKYLYYRVDGGKTLEAIERVLARMEEQNEVRRKFTDRFNAEGYYANSSSISALRFTNGVGVPDGWKQSAWNYYRPNGKTKEGRALLKEMANMPLSGWRDLNHELTGGDFIMIRGARILSISVEKVGDKWILMVPKYVARGENYAQNESWEPADELSVRIKTSEYWRMKEEAGMDPDVIIQEEEE